MTTKKKAAAPANESKALSLPGRAVVALGYNAKTTKELTDLAAQSASITEITNTAGYDQCHAARMVLKNARLEITKRGKAAREDATAFSKAVIAEETRLIGLIETEEDRLQKLQDEHDAKIEAERQAAALVEQRRCEAHALAIEVIRRHMDLPVNPSPDAVMDQIAKLTRIEVGPAFEEFEQQAHDARGSTMLYLRQEHQNAVDRVAREEQARKDREENERLRAELAAANKREADRLAAEAAERKRQDNERAEQARIAEAEERGRLMAESARLRQEEAAKQPIAASTEPPKSFTDVAHRLAVQGIVPTKAGDPHDEVADVVTTEMTDGTVRQSYRPTLEAMANVLANFYNTDQGTVLNWLDAAVRGTRRAA